MPAKCHCKVIQRCSGKKLFLKIWQFHSKTHVPESPFNKVAGQRLATSIKKILWHRFFPVNITKFLGISFFKEHLWWLPLVKLDPNLWNQQNFSSNCFRLHLISWAPSTLWQNSCKTRCPQKKYLSWCPFVLQYKLQNIENKNIVCSNMYSTVEVSLYSQSGTKLDAQ